MHQKILALFGSEYIKTGGHKRYFELLKCLAKKGHEIVLISPKNFEEKRISNIIIKHSINLPLPHSIKFLLSVIINKRKINNGCLGCNSILIFGLTNILAALFLKRVFKIPIILAIRSNILESREIEKNNNGLNIIFLNIKNTFLLRFYMKTFLLYLKIIFKNIDKFIVQNNDDKTNLIDKININSKEITVIANNINVSWMDREYENTNKSHKLEKIIFIGTICERKGPMTLLKAFKRINAKNHTLLLKILGDGPMSNDLNKFIKENRLNKKVYLYGNTTNPFKYLSESDLLIVPSLVDSFPNVVLEAFYVGTPVIGSCVGGIKTMLKYKELLFSPGNEEEIYNKITELLDSKYYKEVKELCKKRKKVFIFDWAHKFEKVIIDVNINMIFY